MRSFVGFYTTKIKSTEILNKFSTPTDVVYILEFRTDDISHFRTSDHMRLDHDGDVDGVDAVAVLAVDHDWHVLRIC